MLSIRTPAAWQMILADLALILFLVAMLAVNEDAEFREESESDPELPAIVPIQALYRPGEGAPDIDEWLEQQSPDPRMTLTIVATHRAGAGEEMWERAQALAGPARSTGMAVKVVLREGEASDLYASLGFDEPQ
ncbi:MAG: hypothetical protein AAF687_01940 [Pseudomonadota bacterium]